MGSIARPRQNRDTLFSCAAAQKRASTSLLLPFRCTRSPLSRLDLQVRSTAKHLELTFELNTPQIAGLVYDAVAINTRGPAAVAMLNYPEHVPDAVYARLGITRQDRTDAMSRYLLRQQLLAEGLDLAAGAFSPPDAVAAAADAAAAALAAPDGSAFVPGGPRGLPTYDPLLTLAQEAAILRVGLARARNRIARQTASGRHGFIEVEVKVSDCARLCASASAAASAACPSALQSVLFAALRFTAA